MMVIKVLPKTINALWRVIKLASAKIWTRHITKSETRRSLRRQSWAGCYLTCLPLSTQGNRWFLDFALFEVKNQSCPHCCPRSSYPRRLGSEGGAGGAELRHRAARPQGPGLPSALVQRAGGQTSIQLRPQVSASLVTFVF